MKLQKLFATAALGLSFLAAGCGSETAQAAPDGGSAAAAPSAGAEVAPTGDMIEVKMVTDDKGNYFEPAEIAAKPGDVLRFTLVSGVHNVSFPAGENANAAGLPGPGEMLQLPGQTYDVPVSFAAGEYKFQCDPHAALGMVGKLRVEG